MQTNAIEIRGLEKTFPGFHLGPIDLTVPTGAIYGFIGPNGAGKTTTIDLLFGMGMKDSGSIKVLGLDHMRDEVAVKSRTGYVSPELTFQAWGKVGKAIQFVKGFYPGWDQTYCDRLLKDFGLNREDKIHTLSFGARVKLSLLLALSWHPKILILDEPTVGLDAVTKQQVFGELLEMVKDGDRTVFISSHGLADIERFADHIAMIKSGRVLLEGATAEIIERFQIVDVVPENDGITMAGPGLYPQRGERDRQRVLVDKSKSPLNWIESVGARQVATAPVTLEELFIALARE